MLKKCTKFKQTLEEAGQSYRKNQLDDNLKLVQSVLENASASLKVALDKKDLLGIQVVHKLLESSRKKVDSLTENREELSKKRDKVGEKRRNTIDNFFANIKKTKK